MSVRMNRRNAGTNTISAAISERDLTVNRDKLADSRGAVTGAASVASDELTNPV